MLDAMRKRASSWLVRVLLGVLIVSFAIWGIGDIFLGSSSSGVVAEVGDLEVDVRDVDRAFEDRLAQLRQSLGGAIDRQQAMAFGLLNQAVQSQVAERLVDMHGRELDIGVADEQIRQAIQSDPLFRGAGGYDRGRLDIFLRSQGISEARLIDETREQIRRRSLLLAMTGLDEVPATLGRELHEFRNQQRRATALIVDNRSVEVEDPDEPTLQAYLEANQDRYQAPDYRRGVVVGLEPDDLVDEIAVDDARLRETYEQRRAGLTRPERRKLAQLLAPDEATAMRLAEKIDGGASLADVAEEAAADGVSYSTIGPVSRADLPDALAEAAFALSEDAVSAPVQSDFGFHLFRLIEVEEGSVVPFEDASAEIEAELKRRDAANQLPDLAARLDDEIAAGESLEVAAESLGLELTAVDPIDAQGRRKDGGGTIDLAPAILRAFFGGETGDTSLLEETEAGYFMYRVDEVEAARPLSLDEARERLVADWREEQQAAAGKTLADELLGRASEGATFRALADERPDSVRVEESGPMLRTEGGGTAVLGREAVQKLFDTDQGRLADETVEVAGGWAVLRNEEIIDAEPPEDLDELSFELSQQMQGDLLVEYEGSLRLQYPVSINERALSVFVDQADPQG